jgi:hypothetical protein
VTNSQGVTRRTEWCKQRHAAIMKAGEAAPAEQQQQQPMLGPDGQPLDAAAGGNIASLATLTKQQVCELRGHHIHYTIYRQCVSVGTPSCDQVVLGCVITVIVLRIHQEAQY